MAPSYRECGADGPSMIFCVMGKQAHVVQTQDNLTGEACLVEHCVSDGQGQPSRTRKQPASDDACQDADINLTDGEENSHGWSNSMYNQTGDTQALQMFYSNVHAKGVNVKDEIPGMEEPYLLYLSSSGIDVTCNKVLVSISFPQSRGRRCQRSAV